jgi:transposase
VWASPGKNAETLNAFFEERGKERCAQLEAVTLDMSGAYLKAVPHTGPSSAVLRVRPRERLGLRRIAGHPATGARIG